ncbi:hypothetical protein ABMA27_003032 [Loxostege sticticalis]|uniref:DUF7869 domain-containing protein n=1 Tax=Loxostege sticticalis TaxID=481309 RepID=A0ABR3HRR6_LOXSC
MEVPATPARAGKARKRTKHPDKWKANIAKKMRLTIKFHRSFYSTSKKSVQDALILKCCKAKKVKRRRPTKNAFGRTPPSYERWGRDFNIKYRIIRGRHEFVPVCQKAFLKILGITKYRVEYVLKHLFYTGAIAKELRGGNRKINKYKDQKESIRQYIMKLKCIESHYCRSATQERKYLSSDLNINKLYKMFKDENPQSPVKQSYFRHIFKREFNLGFGNPKTDKNEVMTSLRVHKLRSKAFFKMMQEKEDDMITFSFDCQKNSPLPRIPDQSAYYSRQFYLYNLTIVQGPSKDKLDKDTTFAYTWTENEFGITVIRLFADGCGGQNKNSIMLGMLSKWLLEHATVKKIEIIFPVTGHSFMPPDRVFGNTEKVIKKREVIIQPEEYCNVISSNATVTNLRDIEVFQKRLDFKSATQKVYKPTAKWPFKIKITQCKRFIIKRSKTPGNTLIRGEMFYQSDLNKSSNVCKTAQKTSMLRPTTISLGAPVTRAKIADVDKLLQKHFGLYWKERDDLKFYLDIIRGPTSEENQNLEESWCEGISEESPDLRV